MHIESIRSGASAATFRPYTGGGTDLRAATDPINLVFVGEPDALGIRAALRGLGAGRAKRWDALVEPNAVWTDAVGGAQTAYAPDFGWSAGAVQLELGDFSGIRAHLRLFPFPGFVLGAAHLERLAAGSFEHDVFSWSGAEALVVRELERAGVVARRTSQSVKLEAARRLSGVVIPQALLAASGYRDGAPELGEPIPGWGSLSVVSLKGLPTGGTPSHLRWTRLTLDTPVTLPAIAAQAALRVFGPIDIEHEVRAEHGRLRARTQVRGNLTIDLGGRATPTHVHEWQLARVHGGLGRIRSARRYLTGGLSAGLVATATEAGLTHTVHSRVDRLGGPQVSVSARW